MLHISTSLILRCFSLIILTLAFLLPWESQSGSTRSFSSGSFDQLLKSREGDPFVLIFWSLDCHSCLQELDLLHKQLITHSGMDLVMVSTDDSKRQAEVEAMLSKYHLDNKIESWIFSEISVQKLRYEIDQNWFGEMPRSYFYDAKHQRVSLSGKVTEKHFDDWRASVRINPSKSTQ